MWYHFHGIQMSKTAHTQMCKICTRARVAKKSTADCNRAPRLFPTLLVYHAQGARLHAVHAPRRVALLVADGDGEAAVVGAHQIDLLALLALDLQARTLAPVLRPPLRTWGGKDEQLIWGGREVRGVNCH